ISVSDPPPPPPNPVNDESAPSFDFKLNPASFAFERFTGPTITGLSTGPVIVKFAVKVPPCSFDPGGSTTPTAGKNPSKSPSGMPCAFNFISTLVGSAEVL